MRFTDPAGAPPAVRRALAIARATPLTLALLLMAGCSRGPAPSGAGPASAPGPAGIAAWPAASATLAAGPGPAGDRAVHPVAPPTPGDAVRAAALPGPAKRAARHWDDYRLQAAQRIVAANPLGSHVGPVSEPLLAIPVLEIELNADGSVRRILVLRRPTQAPDTVQLAIDAVHRAAPFAPVGALPRPWKFAEVFLFDEHRRFKPRSLDL